MLNENGQTNSDDNWPSFGNFHVVMDCLELSKGPYKETGHSFPFELRLYNVN